LHPASAADIRRSAPQAACRRGLAVLDCLECKHASFNGSFFFCEVIVTSLFITVTFRLVARETLRAHA
jgi:hypothetical protein